MASLDGLPQPLRLRIFRYLLAADQVRQPHNRLLIEHYKFEVQLLQVSRTVKQDAEHILYNENKFVKLTWYSDLGHKMMLNHEVPFFKLTPSAVFDRHVAEITIKLEDSRPGNVKKPQLSILHLDDIPKLARLLRIADLANFMGYKFGFKMRAPALSVSEQEKLLAPFQQVRGGAYRQDFTITGPVDPALAHRVEQATTQQIQWLRAVAWEINDLVASIARQGDLGLSLGNFDMALAKYNDAEEFAEAAFKQNHMVENIDEQFEQARTLSQTIRYTNRCLLILLDPVFEDQGAPLTDFTGIGNRLIQHIEKSNESSRKDIHNTLFARYYHLVGIYELRSGRPNKAGKNFAKAYKYLQLHYIKEGYEVAKTWPKLSPEQRKRRVDAVRANMPTKPLDLPEMAPYSCPMVASDHWVMRQLGHKGPIPYSDKITTAIAIVMTTKPHPNHPFPGRPRTARIGEVKPDVLRKYVQSFRAQLKHPKIPKGVKAMAWVGFRADQIGEESVLDDPEHASWIEQVSREVREKMRMA